MSTQNYNRQKGIHNLEYPLLKIYNHHAVHINTQKRLILHVFSSVKLFLCIIESLLFQIICRSSWTGYHEAQSKLIRSVAISSSIFGNSISLTFYRVLHRIQNFRITISFQTFQPINVIKVIKVVILFLILEDEY